MHMGTLCPVLKVVAMKSRAYHGLEALLLKERKGKQLLAVLDCKALLRALVQAASGAER